MPPPLAPAGPKVLSSSVNDESPHATVATILAGSHPALESILFAEVKGKLRFEGLGLHAPYRFGLRMCIAVGYKHPVGELEQMPGNAQIMQGLQEA